MSVDMLENILPDVVLQLENGEITQQEAMELFREYMDSLSNEERNELMQSIPKRENREMPQRERIE